MAVDETNIKFSDLYSIINNTTHTDQSVSLSDFRGEGTVPASGPIGIGLHFKGKTFASTNHQTIETVRTKLTDANLNTMKTALIGAGGTMYEIHSDMAYELSSIHDGGNDIYDYGNKISFNSNSNYLTYKNTITSNGIGSGNYFVKIGPSAKRFFIFVSDLDSSITNVQINGNLGADGQGSVDGGVQTMTNNNIEYKIYWKSVHDGRTTGDPTLNHIWILRNVSGISRTYASSDTNNDSHVINTNGDIERIYYIMWAGARIDGFTDENEVLKLTASFLGIIDGPENIEAITSYGADDIAYINCTSVTNFNNKTFLEYISSHGVTGSSSNTDNTQWQNGYSGLISYDVKPLTSGNDYFTTTGDYGLRFIHGDGSVDGPDWVVIDFGPLNNGDFDGYYQNTVGRYFGGESSTSGGGGGIYTSSSNKGMLWGYNQGWKLLYQLPLGVRNSSYNKGAGKWFSSGTLVTSGDGKRAEYDTMKLTHVGFSVGTP
jgi:hypothetical protein